MCHCICKCQHSFILSHAIIIWNFLHTHISSTLGGDYSAMRGYMSGHGSALTLGYLRWWIHFFFFLHTGVHLRVQYLPVESEGGRGFISLSTIFWCRARRLKGSTVNGRVPVSIAYMFTPLEGQKTHFSSVCCQTNVFEYIDAWRQLITLRKGRIHSHGPDIHLRPVLLPGEQLRGGVGRTSTLGAEWVWVSQDASTVTEAKIWGDRRRGGGECCFWVYCCLF